MNGKISIEAIKPLLARRGRARGSFLKVISVSQATEYGTVYTVEEICAIAIFAHSEDLYLHIDGQRGLQMLPLLWAAHLKKCW